MLKLGYGNIAPRTELGKISTIFYAIIGMYYQNHNRNITA